MDDDCVIVNKSLLMKKCQIGKLLGEASGMARGLSWQESPFKGYFEKIYLLIDDAIDLIINEGEPNDA